MLDERLRIEDPSSYSERRYQYLISYNLGKKTRPLWKQNGEFKRETSRVANVVLSFAIKDDESLQKVEDALKKQDPKNRDVLIESFSFFSE